MMIVFEKLALLFVNGEFNMDDKDHYYNLEILILGMKIFDRNWHWQICRKK